MTFCSISFLGLSPPEECSLICPHPIPQTQHYNPSIHTLFSRRLFPHRTFQALVTEGQDQKGPVDSMFADFCGRMNFCPAWIYSPWEPPIYGALYKHRCSSKSWLILIDEPLGFLLGDVYVLTFYFRIVFNVKKNCAVVKQRVPINPSLPFPY